MGIADNMVSLTKDIPPPVKIIAVSKTKPVSALMEAYNAGQRAFGENKVQELIQKQPEMPADTEWHLIGHLQTNKVKYIVPFVSMIQSVDSLKLLKEINREALKIGRTIDCLLQMRIAAEETKFGLTFQEVEKLLSDDEFSTFNYVRIRGVMGMATFTDDTAQIKSEFMQLSRMFDEMKGRWFVHDDAFNQRSMGMSGDYLIAIEAGSTMVRIGSLIFGERNYKN